MVRLNLFTLLLAYTMNTDYISYYFSPLVSWWFLVIYSTMAVGSRYNERTPFLICKILCSAVIITWIMNEEWLLEALFDVLAQVCGIHWSAREWGFRVTLDLWIVYFGMFTSLAVIKIREHRITDHPHWPLAVKASIVVSGVVLLWFFGFELFQESKFTYNLWHPYISFMPVLAFVVLRNANVILRSASSRGFAFVGACSLETFIIQYHYWLAGDTKGVLLVIPGTRWRPLNFILTTIMFIYLSHRVAQATGEITKWICGGPTSKTLPLPVTTTETATSLSSVQRDSDQEAMIPMIPPNRNENENDEHIHKDSVVPESDIPGRRRWVDRLADGSSERAETPTTPGFRVWYGETEWNPGVKTKLGLGLAAMWVVNIMWSYH